MKDTESILVLKGIGEKTAKAFEKLDIKTIDDLIHFYPRDYQVFEPYVLSAGCQPGTVCSLKLTISKVFPAKKVRNLTILNVSAFDESGMVQLTFFNMPFLFKFFRQGMCFVFRGSVSRKGLDTLMEQPKYYTIEEYAGLVNELQPMYHLTKGLTNKTVEKAVYSALMQTAYDEEYLTDAQRIKYDLQPRKESVYTMHFPKNREELAQARKRLAFDEILTFLYCMESGKENSIAIPNEYVLYETADTVRFLEQLPYSLTGAQKKVWAQIRENLASDLCMNRLVQGDVGSGKTLLAELALLMCVANGYQGALMAPTEVLARQHFETFQTHAKQYGLCFKPVLLVGSLTAKERREAYEGIQNGTYNLIIGTHALIQDKVEYRNLALVITDEQHRFGVRQRELFAGKGLNPHILVMSATPIPRTLAMILYGDLDISVVDELPANRLPIKNAVVNTGYRQKAYSFIEKQVKEGRQAFVICPMVEEGELENVENVIDYTEKLRNALPSGVVVQYLHGKMKAAQKTEIMEAFAAGNIHILVSTTVIEVGINVPNATVMMVENAERFGLAQLHQLRGRVGRGEHQSYCIFISSNDTKDTMERLNILGKSNDGFFIAAEDMRLRGPGDLFGVRQSGEFGFQIADVYSDGELIMQARELLNELFSIDEDYMGEFDKRTLAYLKKQGLKLVDFRSI